MSAPRTIVLLVFLIAAVAVAGGAPSPSETDEGPVAEAGLDQETPQGTTVYLDAGGSYAPSGDLVEYEWVIEGPDGSQTAPACPGCERTEFTPAQLGEYAVTLTVTDDEGRQATDTMVVTAFEYDRPSVSLSGPAEVDVGDSADVELMARRGEAPLSSLTWLVDGVQQDAGFLGADRASATLSLSTAAPGIREVEAIVSDERGYATTARHRVMVLAAGPHFDVHIDDTSDPIQAGETLAVETTIVNTGREAATQNLLLEARDGSILAVARAVSLAPGEATTRTLTWATAPGDGDIGTVRARTADDTDSESVTIRPVPGNAIVEVTAIDAPSSVEAGEEVPVEAEVRNVGNATARQLLTLKDIDGEPTAFERITLAPEETVERTLVWETSREDSGYGAVSVHTRDDFARHGVRVLEPAFFAVSIRDTNRNGDDLAVTAEVTNTGGVAETQQLTLGLAGEAESRDATTVNLDPDGSTRETLRWDDFDIDTSGAVTVEVASRDDAATRRLTTPCRRSECTYPYFDVSVIMPETLEVGESESLTATMVKWPENGDSGKGPAITDAERELMSPGMWADGDGSPLAWQQGYAWSSDGYASVIIWNGDIYVTGSEEGQTTLCIADETTENHGPGGKWGTCYNVGIIPDQDEEKDDPYS